jgi:hypothetical protein
MIRTVLVMVAMGLLFAFNSTAQVKHPMGKEAAMDTVSQKVNPLSEKYEKAGEYGMKEKEHWRDFKDSPCDRERMENRERDEWNYGRHGPMTMGMMFHPVRHPMLFPSLCAIVCLLAFLFVNIILTILVSLDMAKRRQFHGLWIPVLLLMGIPGTGLYALFRIGDNIMAKEQKI